MTDEQTPKELDKSDAADARRMRWLLNGNGYFMEEEMLCGHPPCGEDEKDAARIKIDEAMRERNDAEAL